MMDKVVASSAEALERAKDGSVALIGGFGSVRQPDAPIEQGSKDLVAMLNNAGAGRVGVAQPMEHTTKDGRPKVVERCGHPLTGLARVTRVCTSLAVPGRGFVVREMAPGVDFDTVQSRSAARLRLDG